MLIFDKKILAAKQHIKYCMSLMSVVSKMYWQKLTEPKTDKASKKPMIVFLGTDAGLKPHFMAHCILARTLRMKGHDARILRCFKSFDRCTVIEGSGLSETDKLGNKNKTCVACVSNALTWAKEYDVPCIDIRPFVSEINGLIASQKIEDYTVDFTYDDIPFGKICLTDILRNYKISSPAYVEQKMHSVLVQYIEDALKNYLVYKQLIKTYNVTSIVYFGDYNLFFPIALSCVRDKVNFSTLHQPAIFHISRDRIIIEKNIWGKGARELPQNFNLWKTLPLSTKMVTDIADDVIYKMENKEGKVYSPPKTSKPDFKSLNSVDSDKKILVAFTSSSDEMDALICQYQSINMDIIEKQQPFSSQISWLQHLIDFVEASEEFFLFIRIHPREGEDQGSEHFQLLKEKLGGQYKNAKIIWPRDPVSSYDLAEVADLVLISWSNIGSDVARMGVPVLSSFNVDWNYPNHHFQNAQDYFTCLRKQLDKKIILEDIQQAFRWFHLRILGQSIEIDDIVKTRHCWTLPPKFEILPEKSDLIEEALCYDKSPLELKYNKLQEVLSKEHFEDERKALIKSIRKFIGFLIFNDVQDYQNIENLISLKNEKITYKNQNNETIEKYSPMAARLVKVLLENRTEVSHGFQ